MLVLLAPAAAHADTVPVSCGEELRTALADSTVVDITLKAGEFCDGTYYLPQRSLTLRGATDASGHNLSGFQSTGGDRSLTTDPEPTRPGRIEPTAVDQVFDHLDFKGTDGIGGGMKWQGGDELTISNSTFDGITTDGPGGGLLIENGDRFDPFGKVTLTNDSFTNNTSNAGDGTGGSGGGARVTAADVTITGSHFTSNKADELGGALALTIADQELLNRAGAPPEDATATISGTTFEDNQSGVACSDGADGGGLYASDGYGAPQDASNFRSVRRDVDPDAGVLALGDNAYRGNEAGATDCNLDAQGGGAAFVGIKAVAFSTETYDGNSAASRNGDAQGGGIAVAATTAGQEDSNPGAVAEYTGQNIVVTNNTAGTNPTVAARGSGSDAPSGAGVSVTGGDVCFGGECTPPDGGDLNLTHSTVTGNTLTSTGTPFGDFSAGVAIDADKYNSVHLDRTIVAFNTIQGGSGRQVRQENGTPDITNSDVTDGCVGRGTAAKDENGNICADPIFAAPAGRAARAASGAPIQAPSSPTVDAVEPLASVTDDFLHQPRPATPGTRADIGAHELQPAKPPAATVTVTPGPSTTSTPTPTVTVKPTPTPNDTGVKDDNSGGKKRSCAGRRFFPIVLRRIGYTFVSAKIKVNGRHVKTIRYTKGVKTGRLGARIDLRKFPRRTIHISIVATTASGKVVKGRRTYHPCYRGRKPHTVPELRTGSQ